jgi:HK97 family phage major capsid protein
MAEEIKDFNQKLEQVLENTTKAQKRFDELEKRNDAIKKEHDEAAKHYADESAKALEEIQKLQQKLAAEEEARQQMEKSLYRLNDGKGEDSELNKKAHNEYVRYFRSKEPISQDVIESVASGFVDKAFVGLTDEQKEYQRKALIAGVNPQGGYWLRPEISTKIITRIFETSPIRSVATVINTSAGSIEMVIDDNQMTSGGWVSETGTRSETATANIGKLEIYAHEQYAMPYLTQTMIEDAGFDIEAWATQKIIRDLTIAENTAFVTGNGSGKPKGMGGYSAWTTNGTYERGKIEQVASGSAGAFTSNGLIDLQNSLAEEYQPNAKWLTKRANWTSILQLKNGQGAYLINPRIMAEGADKVLLGNPVMFANDVASVASNALAMYYGDYREGYVVVDRFGYRIVRDELTSKPYIKLYTTKRTGGAVMNYDAIKIQKLATSI